ncbi:site-specific DNA-methyltransferase [Synergistaceae bacterium OttesenSCG-928-I11]|nr:site-specific DNA-methyltransferase [Synergistaceae bacterium OttesenSCG-928-I11]
MQKLELTWIGKGQEPVVEPRILLHTPDRDYGDPAVDNMLIHGDNLLALKALEQEFSGRVKCIYIDPPYNTGSAFEHYDDNLEHSTWLSLMAPRLRILRNLLSENGSIWISTDDNEYAYLRVLCDEVFGRSNFVCTIIWEKRKSRENRRAFSFKHDYITVYARDKGLFEKARNSVPMTQEVLNRYRNLDNDPRGIWQSVAITAQAGHGTASQFYQIVTPSGRRISPPAGNCWRFTIQRLNELIADNRIYFGANGDNVPRQKKFLSETSDTGLTPETIWYADDVGTNDSAKRHSNDMFEGNGFGNPKPEELIQRILEIASNENDLVLDSFLGSGTTAAVAHKMGRHYIGIELGDHCYTHCLPRLEKVVDGEQGGISSAIGWQGGGGFKFYELAPTLIVKDKHGQPVISDKYDAQMLVAAIAKLNGYAYAPDVDVFWKQGSSQTDSYIFVTTEYLTAAQLDEISNDLLGHERLLICAPAFDIGLGKRYENINVRKIPQSVLDKCEYGTDNYNLNIINPPELDEDEWGDCEDA